ncbi:MAG: hypothetical protein ABFS02_00840 [Pseudomonadota bacterium]
MNQKVFLVLTFIVLPSNVVAGLFGPSAGEEFAMIMAVILGIPALALLLAIGLYLRAKVKLAEQKARSFEAGNKFRFDVFLSYSAKDHAEASQLAEQVQHSELKSSSLAAATLSFTSSISH